MPKKLNAKFTIQNTLHETQARENHILKTYGIKNLILQPI